MENVDLNNHKLFTVSAVMLYAIMNMLAWMIEMLSKAFTAIGVVAEKKDGGATSKKEERDLETGEAQEDIRNIVKYSKPLIRPL